METSQPRRGIAQPVTRRQGAGLTPARAASFFFMQLTFIIPSIGRPTLRRTLDSLIAQTCPDWAAIVVFDGPAGEPYPATDSRIQYRRLGARVGRSNHAGEVRNRGMFWGPDADWFGFVDDDDRLDPCYVEWLRAESEGRDLVVFGMRYPDGRVVPQAGALVPEGVGISFAVRKDFLTRTRVRFVPGPMEDYVFIDSCRKAGAVLAVSDRIAYYNRH